MDDAKADHLYFSESGDSIMPSRVAWRDDCVEAFGVSLRRTVVSADLGGSSNMTSENLVDRSGKGFRVE